MRQLSTAYCPQPGTGPRPRRLRGGSRQPTHPRFGQLDERGRTSPSESQRLEDDLQVFAPRPPQILRRRPKVEAGLGYLVDVVSPPALVQEDAADQMRQPLGHARAVSPVASSLRRPDSDGAAEDRHPVEHDCVTLDPTVPAERDHRSATSSGSVPPQRGHIGVPTRRKVVCLPHEAHDAGMALACTSSICRCKNVFKSPSQERSSHILEGRMGHTSLSRASNGYPAPRAAETPGRPRLLPPGRASTPMYWPPATSQARPACWIRPCGRSRQPSPAMACNGASPKPALGGRHDPPHRGRPYPAHGVPRRSRYGKRVDDDEPAARHIRVEQLLQLRFRFAAEQRPCSGRWRRP